MSELLQDKTPLVDALNKYKQDRIVSFDVPGHKQGKGNPELTSFLGAQCLSVDVNSMKPLDNLTHPVSIIKEAEELAADAFTAEHAFFIVNGTTAAVQAMIMAVCAKGDKIIIPRNIHISAINAIVLCGAVPIYVNPKVDKRLGIPLGITVGEIEEAILKHPDAKAVFVNNPTYYGICSDLKTITEFAHKHNLKVLVDEAHGTHFSFHNELPISGMDCGADMSAISMHKTGGSLTQSSILLLGKNMNADYVRQIINLTQTTSASYLLLSSLDISRKNLALNGESIFKKVDDLASYARDEINRIGGYYAFSNELCDGGSVFDFDTTKLSIHTRDIGLAGIEVYDILRDEYGIQVEFGDIGNILAIISVGDSKFTVERLIAALYEIKRRYQKDPQGMFDHEYISPISVMTPQDAFYTKKNTLSLEDSIGCISAEYVMSYPPGIPVLAPGERITQEIVDYIQYAKIKGCKLTGAEDITINTIKVVEE